jgi:hypothetical protein
MKYNNNEKKGESKIVVNINIILRIEEDIENIFF